jgi:hypothetical protein
VREIAWLDGIGKLIASLDNEPVPVSLIFSILHRDPQLRNQINAMLDRDQINRIIRANGGVDEWIDLTVPEHIRRCMMGGNKNEIGLIEQESYIKSALADILVFETAESDLWLVQPGNEPAQMFVHQQLKRLPPIQLASFATATKRDMIFETKRKLPPRPSSI